MSIRPYIQIARPDHWFKNIFMVPGVLLAYYFRPDILGDDLWWRLLVGLAAACLVASSNYVLNETLDAPKDAFHPEKRSRPVPSGQVRIPLAYAEWGLLALAGLVVGFALNWRLGLSALLLWVAGTLYNVPPVRLKDVAYGDVLSESLNNPIRFLLGWYATGCTRIPPVSMLLAYWMFGAFLMAMKRFAEYRTIGDPEVAARYRKSFGYYNEERLTESLFFYGALFGMLSGFFMARYQVGIVLATPIVAYAMAYYMHLGFKRNSPVQNPEKLYRQRKLVLLVVLAFLAAATLLLVDLPLVRSLLAPMPVQR